jgi:outer membrane protein OmpA-like peptidoglycan-associated protein
MRKIIAAALLLAVSAQLSFAQRRPATEAEALAYIYSAFLTQADPAVMANPVVLGPELQRELAMQSSGDGAKVYDALIARADGKTVDVRKATPREVGEYGVRRGFDPRSGQPLYTLEAGDLRFLLQYDLQRLRIAFVGRLGVADPDPRPVAVEPMKQLTSTGVTAVAMREVRLPSPPAPLNLHWTGQFPFDSAELTPEARAALDREIVPQLMDATGVSTVLVSGHADRLGAPEYNQWLSEKRAEAVRAYLVAKGIDDAKIEILSYGQTAPVRSCAALKGNALLECLAPNRRVVLEVRAP